MFYFNHTASAEIYTLSLHDALPICCRLALLPFLISCLIWLDLVASLPLIKERILVIISGRLATRSEERFSRNAETDLVCRLLLEKKKKAIVAIGGALLGLLAKTGREVEDASVAV